MFILDTNVVSELRRPNKVDPAVAAWANSVKPHLLFLSAITILEVEIGAQRRERRDPTGAVLFRQWVDDWVLPSFDGRILPIDTAVALRCASLHVPDPKSDRDAFIAATALVHGMTVATRNLADFARTGASLLNPWSFRDPASP